MTTGTTNTDEQAVTWFMQGQSVAQIASTQQVQPLAVEDMLREAIRDCRRDLKECLND